MKKKTTLVRYLLLATSLLSMIGCSLTPGLGGRASDNQTGALPPTGEPIESAVPTLEPSPTGVPTLAPIPTETSTPTQEPTPTTVLSGELKIGVIAPLSGSSSAFGNAIRNGITLAVDERNAIVLVRDGQRSFFTRVTP